MATTSDKKSIWPPFNLPEFSVLLFLKWSKDGSWYRLWTTLLKIHKAFLDMSSVELDGSHTPVKRGGEAVGYQGRKKAKRVRLLPIRSR